VVGRVVDAGKPRTLTVEGRRRGCGAGLRGEAGNSIPGGVLSGDGDEAEISAGSAGRQQQHLGGELAEDVGREDRVGREGLAVDVEDDGRLLGGEGLDRFRHGPDPRPRPPTSSIPTAALLRHPVNRSSRSHVPASGCGVHVPVNRSSRSHVPASGCGVHVPENRLSSSHDPASGVGMFCAI